jgi:transposase-like protein
MTFRQAAADLGIDESMLRSWAKSAERDGPETFRGHGVPTEVEARLAARQRGRRTLQEERDIFERRQILREGALVK